MTDSSAEAPGAHPGRRGTPTALKGLAFMLFVTIMAGLLAIFILSQRSKEGPKVAVDVTVPMSVSVVEVRLQDHLRMDEKFSGLIVARRASRLGFTAGGRVDRVWVDIGDPVNEGDPMASLDTRAVSAQLAAANARVAEAEATHALALVTAQRQAALAAKGHLSKQLADEAEAQARTARARIDASLAEARALGVQISLSTIEAPFAGVITERFVDEGAIAAPGQVILELVERDQLEARIGLTADLASGLQIGSAYTLTTEAGDVEATLRTVTGIIDRTSRTVAAVFDLPRADHIDPGAVARLTLPDEQEEMGFWVPVSALSERERGLWSVYVARRLAEGWHVQADRVEIIHTSGERAYVRGGLRDQDLVIMEGLHRLTPGQLVTPLDRQIALTDRTDG